MVPLLVIGAFPYFVNIVMLPDLARIRAIYFFFFAPFGGEGGEE